MKKLLIILVLGLSLISLQSCNKVPVGHVGVKVYLLGGDKGVDHEVLTTGRYWIGINEELHLFPTFTQNYVWTADVREGSPNDESLYVQTKGGLKVGMDVGITYHLKKDKIGHVFEKYRRGVEEITDVFLRNIVRDAFNQVVSRKKVQSVYGEGKAQMLEEVLFLVKSQTDEQGIIVERLYLVGDLRLPKEVTDGVNRKIQATQKAEQRENELREAEAAAKKKVAEAEGEAASILVKAQAQAKANKIISSSLSKELIQYEALTKWDGALPKVTSDTVPIIDLK